MRTFRALIVVGLLAAKPSQAQLVTQPVNKDFTVMNGGSPPHVIVPLRALPGVGKLSAVVTRAVVGGKPRPTSFIGFVANYDETKRQLELRLDASSGGVGLAPGVYDVSVELTGEVAAAGTEPLKARNANASSATVVTQPTDAAPVAAGGPAEPKLASQPLELQLYLPPGHLATIPPIKVTYDRFASDADLKRSIMLTDLGGVTTLNAITVRQTQPATNGDWQTEAHFDARGVPSKLEPGQTATVELEGRAFPLGVTKGELLVGAHELEQVLTVPFEVKARRSEWFIILVFLVAGFMGWLVRHRLRQLEARAVLEAQVAPLLRKARREAERTTDAKQAQALNSAVANVSEALDGDDQAMLEARVSALSVAVDAALAARANAMNGAFQAASALESLVKTPWRLPPAARGPEATALARVTDANTALLADDLREARKALNEARVQSNEVCRLVSEWIVGARPDVVDFIAAAQTLAVPSSLRSFVDEKAKAAGDQLQAVPAFDSATYTDDSAYAAAAEVYLRAASTARTALAQLVVTVQRSIRAAVDDSISVLRKAGKADSEIATVLAVRELTISDEPLDDLRSLRDQSDRFMRSLAALMGAVTAEIRGMLEEGDYKAALRASGVGTNLEIADADVDRRPSPLSVTETTRQDVQAPARQTYLLQRPLPSDPIAFTQARLGRIQAWRGAVSATILAVATWAVYREAWVGTSSDIIGIAVVAFFSDFTLDAVVGALDKLRKPA